MSIAKKFLLAAFAATILLALTGGIAAALRSLGSNKREIALLARSLSFSSESGLSVVCNVGLNTTLNQLRNAKREGTVVGSAEAVILSCSQGTARVLNTPWLVKYKSIGGTLPRITSITNQLERTQFLVTLLGTLCLITAESSAPQEVINGTVGNLTGRPFTLIGTTIRTELNTGFEFCPRRPEGARLLGTFEPVNGPITVELA